MYASLTPFSIERLLNSSEEEAHGWRSRTPGTAVTRAAAGRQNRPAANRSSRFTNKPATLPTVLTSMVFLAQNFLYIVYILHFSLDRNNFFYPIYSLSWSSIQADAGRVLGSFSPTVSFHCHPQQPSHMETQCRALFPFPSAGRKEASDLILFTHPTKTTISAWKQMSHSSKNYGGTNWKSTGPDKSNHYLKHYCALLISLGSMWTLTVDCNPLGWGKKKNTLQLKNQYAFTWSSQDL